MRVSNLAKRLAVLTIIISGLVAFNSPKSFAAEPTSEELAGIYLEKMQAWSAMDTMLQYMTNSIVGQLTQHNPQATEELKSKVAKAMKDVFTENIQEVKDAMTFLYTERFTREELLVMVEFVNSPAGTKLNRLAPTLTQEGIAYGHRWGQSLAPKIQQRVREVLENHKEQEG